MGDTESVKQRTWRTGYDSAERRRYESMLPQILQELSRHCPSPQDRARYERIFDLPGADLLFFLILGWISAYLDRPTWRWDI